jgi:hypothetical protein
MKRATIEQLVSALRLRDDSGAERATWSDEDCEGMQQLLAFEGAELWMYRCVQQGRLHVPPQFKANLRTAAQHISVVNMRIDAQTVAVTRRLNDAHIPWALIKGQSRRAAVSLYPFADARAVSDVDLLIPEQHADAAWHLLCDHGFRRVIEGPVDWTADHHFPTIIDASNVSVELHTTTGMSVSPREAWHRLGENGQPVEWSGLSVQVPNATELVWQALSHGAADGSEGYTLKAFLSVAAVLTASSGIDWPLIHARIVSNETLDGGTQQPVPHERIKRFLDIAAALAGVAVPPLLVARSRVRLEPLLLWRARVLSSNLPRAVKGRLLEESARVEVLQPITPIVTGAGALKNLRRRVSSVVARLAYQLWG